MRRHVTEKLLADIWKRHLVTTFETDTGEKVIIVHPGKPNSFGGSDFKGVILYVDGKMIEGDAEIHVASSQWYRHGHHRDPQYNRVVVHIVWHHDIHFPVRLANGRPVLTVALSRSFGALAQQLGSATASPQPNQPSCPAVNGKLPVLTLLAAAGKERFFNKVEFFKEALATSNVNQLFLRSISRALGYSQNIVQFERLADVLHDEMTGGFMKVDESKKIRALLFGLAGLLPSQRPNELSADLSEDEEVRCLEIMWQSADKKSRLKFKDWCFFRVRPDNFPQRRLAALGALLWRYNRQGLLEGILNLLEEATYNNKPSGIKDGLIVKGDGYWGNHIDFGVVKKQRSALLGQDRATEIIINILLPFAAALGDIWGRPDINEGAVEIYRQHSCAGENEVTRYMRSQLGLSSQLTLSANQQQGLIHIFRLYCLRRLCTSCSLARR